MSNNDLQKAEKQVAAAQAVVADLEAKRDAAARRGTELADERGAVALAAHTGDAEAAKRLQDIRSAASR